MLEHQPLGVQVAVGSAVPLQPRHPESPGGDPTPPHANPGIVSPDKLPLISPPGGQQAQQEQHLRDTHGWGSTAGSSRPAGGGVSVWHGEGGGKFWLSPATSPAMTCTPSQAWLPLEAQGRGPRGGKKAERRRKRSCGGRWWAPGDNQPSIHTPRPLLHTGTGSRPPEALE